MNSTRRIKPDTNSAKSKMQSGTVMVRGLQKRFTSEIRGELQKTLNISNPMQVPGITKVVVNVGLGEAVQDKKIIAKVEKQLATITGQKPKVTQARKSIATFKLREGMPIGLKVTLRGARMYDFLEKLTTIVFTRVRDFRGISLKGFDGRGNYSFGFSEQIVFPEIEYGSIDKIRGLEVTIVTSAPDDAQALALLQSIGMPFEKEKKE